MARLHSQIYVSSLLVLVAVAVSIALVFALGTRGAAMGDVAGHVVRYGAAIAAERRDDPVALRRWVDQLHRDFGADVTVRDLDGRVLAASGRPLPLPRADELATIRQGAVVTRHRWRGWYVAAPVRDEHSGQTVAVLAATVRPHPGPSVLLWPVTAAAIILLVVAVATAPLARRIARPVEQLTEAVRRFGRGDLGYRAPPPVRRGAAELAELTRAFNETAERVERMVRGEKELLANVSHELRSPLARIRVALALLPRDADTEARLPALEADLDDLDRLIEDVLTTARLGATGLPTHVGPVETSRLLGEVAQRARHDPITAGTSVSIADGAAIEFTGDEALLRRALWNLVENAAKYGRPPIVLAAERRGDWIALTVTDDGPGIAPADRERVFAPFYRGDSARTPSGDPRRGTGLGLTLTRRVAEVHGGTVAIEPAATPDGRERGCRAVLSVPLAGPR